MDYEALPESLENRLKEFCLQLFLKHHVGWPSVSNPRVPKGTMLRQFFKYYKSERLGLREMERNRVVAKYFAA